MVKIQGVVHHLVDILLKKLARSDFELDNKDDGPDDHDGVEPAPHSRYRELQMNCALPSGESSRKQFILANPGISLRWGEIERTVPSHLAEDLVRSRGEKSFNGT